MKSSFPSFLRVGALLAVTVFPWAGCFETPYDPSGGKNNVNFNPSVNVNSGDWKEVPSSGGTIELEELSLNFPASAFNGDSKVAVSTVKKNPFSFATALSKVYQVAFPSEGTGKAVNLSITYDGDPDDVVMLVNTPTWSQHTMNMAEHVFPLDFTVEGGHLSAQIPATGEAEGKTPYFQVGLVANGITETKADDMDKDLYKDDPRFSLYVGRSAVVEYRGQPSAEEVEKLNKWNQLFKTLKAKNVPDAFACLSRVGFELPTDRVRFVIEDFGSDSAWGYSESSAFFKTWGYIRLNSANIMTLAQQAPSYSTDLTNQINQTLVHELFHTVHDWVYDINRSPWQRASDGAEGDYWAMLSEAIGCWVEKTTGDKRIGENCISFAADFINSFWPLERDANTYQNHGYGMGLFIEWLARKSSDNKIVKLVQYQRSGEKSLPNAFNQFLAEEKLTFFTPEDYNAFATSVVTRKFDDRIKTEHLIGSNVKTIKSLPDNYVSDVWSFGVHVAKIGFAAQLYDKAENAVKTINLTQDREDLVSMVYLDTDKSITYIGEFTKEKPFSCTMQTLKDAGLKALTIVTARKANIEKGGQMVSRINVEMGLDVRFISFENRDRIEYWSKSGDYDQIMIDENLRVSADNGESRIYFTISVSNGKIGDLTNLSWECYNLFDFSYSSSLVPLRSLDGSSGHWSNDACIITVTF